MQLAVLELYRMLSTLCEENWGPRPVGFHGSERTTRSAVSEAEGNLERGTKCTYLEKLSTMVNMVVLLLEGGRPVTKFTAM